MKKRILAILLTIIMLTGAIPVNATVNEGTPTDSYELSAEREITSIVDEERSLHLASNFMRGIQTFAMGDTVYIEQEPNDLLEQSDRVDNDDTYVGEVLNDDTDVFAFQLEMDTYVDIYLLADVYGCVAGLYDNNGKLMYEFEYAGTDENGFHVNTLQVKLPGNTSSNDYYYIGVGLDTYFDTYSTYAFHTLFYPFLDVSDSSKYFYDPVIWAVQNGITSGVTEEYFKPNNTCTRAQVVTFLWRAAGQPEPKSTVNPFTDIKPGKYFYKAVLWAAERGITSGVTKTTFGPEESCTRAQVVSFLWRAAGQPEPRSYNNPFSDVGSNKYYYKSVLWAVENGITSGFSADIFGPNSTCTRGQIVSFLYRGNGSIDWDALNAAPPIELKPPHSDLYIEGVPVEDVIMYFSEVCLDSEYSYGGNSSLIQKWTGPISYIIYGNPTSKDLQVLNSFVQWLNSSVPGFPGMYETDNKYAAVLEIYFCSKSEMVDHLGENFNYADGGVTYWYEENEIYNGTICYVNSIDQYVRNSVILEEIYNGLGAVQDTSLRPDSIIYQYYTTPQSLTDIDELIIKLLYHPDIKCGMNASQCGAVIRNLYY